MQRKVSVALLSAAMLVASAAGTAHGAAPAPGEPTFQDLTVDGVGSPHYSIRNTRTDPPGGARVTVPPAPGCDDEGVQHLPERQSRW
ncbi:hypothetical protein [Streptomyces atratus]|uniref:hypothetical protein n=1 Tax=Streptomyces atratus TaxID=1893 RepID=UPI00365761D5